MESYETLKCSSFFWVRSITLSALSTVLDAEEKTFFTAFETRDAAIM